ncbi:MAG: pseudouridine synthase [Bacilli bacterium]
MQERLQKLIASSGVTSRRKAEELITQGRVTVNGKVVRELGVKASMSDTIEVDGVPIGREEKVYALLYKPRGVLSSVSDPKNRRCVTDFFEALKVRLFPVGRLDYETSGLLIMTNDGDFANQLMHPRFEMPKTYVARVNGHVTEEQMKQLQYGIMLEDGKTAPAQVKALGFDKTKNKSLIQITIHEGRNRQVRRMFEALGHKVDKLKRESYGFLTLGGLRSGDWRYLTPHEVKQLRNLSQNKQK